MPTITEELAFGGGGEEGSALGTLAARVDELAGVAGYERRRPLSMRDKPACQTALTSGAAVQTRLGSRGSTEGARGQTRVSETLANAVSLTLTLAITVTLTSTRTLSSILPPLWHYRAAINNLVKQVGAALEAVGLHVAFVGGHRRRFNDFFGCL